MVIINFHGLVMLDKLIGWAPQEIVVEKRIKKEASHSMNGPIKPCATPYWTPSRNKKASKTLFRFVVETGFLTGYFIMKY